MSDNRIHYSNKGIPMLSPLYLYPESSDQTSMGEESGRKPNLDPGIVQKISEAIGFIFVPDHELPEAKKEGVFTPMDVLDYIYAVLHSPSYREKYKEFLKIDFPRVPYPASAEQFKKLVALGGELRKWHLMEHSDSKKLITTFPESGTNILEKGFPKFEDGKVHINKDQHFDGVPETAWNFYIGGYQPAQKWLKDRKGRTLSFDDVTHYQKIVKALFETDRLMKEVGGVIAYE